MYRCWRVAINTSSRRPSPPTFPQPPSLVPTLPTPSPVRPVPFAEPSPPPPPEPFMTTILVAVSISSIHSAIPVPISVAPPVSVEAAPEVAEAGIAGGLREKVAGSRLPNAGDAFFRGSPGP
ncbi:hypothetical protein D9758_016354 [Tetrapyrgos nigripes]|uniref:Uncharacterized protein n=1 Tax=Tetrapyrgos nigripes TaxID=182062 RepID=A0A8H5BY61_9AGAR|nr:hypothetical protein D9758_016354 [Tetrapyrgos nigripes]